MNVSGKGTDDKLYQRLYNEFEKHLKRFEQHERDEMTKYENLIAAQQRNTDAISALTESVSSLVDDTRAIVQLHKDFQGAARVGAGMQRFMIWCLKWGMIGTGIVTGLNWLIEHFNR